MPRHRLAAFSIVGLVAYEWSTLLLPRTLLERHCATPEGWWSHQVPPICEGLAQFFDFLWSVNTVALPLLGAIAVFFLLDQLRMFHSQATSAAPNSLFARAALLAGAVTVLLAAAVVAIMVTTLISGAWWKFAKFHEASISVGMGAFLEFLLIECALMVLGYSIAYLASRYAHKLAAAAARFSIAFVLVGVGLYVPFFLSPLAEWRA